MGFPVMFGQIFLAQLAVDEGEVVVSCLVFRIQLERFLKLLDRQVQKLFLGLWPTSLQLGTQIVCLTQFIDHHVILAEIKVAIFQFLVSVFQNTPIVGDGLIQFASLSMDLPRKPGHRPAWRLRIKGRGSLQSLGSIIHSSLLEIDSSEVDGPFRATQSFHLAESSRCLLKFSLVTSCVALEQQSDSIIIPPLPHREILWLNGKRSLALWLNAPLDTETEAIFCED